MKKKSENEKKMPPSKEKVRVSTRAMNDGQGKTKEPLAQDLIP